MKKLTQILIAAVLLPLALSGATANEYYFTKRNAANTSNEQKTAVPTASSFLTANGSLDPAWVALANLPTWAAIAPGTGVGTALAVNVGSAGAIVVNGGVLGTPSSGVATNLTGTAAGLTAGNATLAATATALATPRTIGGTSFNGTADVASFPSPGAIGGGTPSTGAFTTLSATGVITASSNRIVIGTSGVSDTDTFLTLYPQTSGGSIYHIANWNSQLRFSRGAIGAESTDDAQISATGLSVFPSTASTTKDTGALVVANGGLGVEENINAGGSITSGSSVQVGSGSSLLWGSRARLYSPSDGNVTIRNAANSADGNLQVAALAFTTATGSNNTDSTSVSTGAVITPGGIGAAKSIYAGEDVYVSKSIAANTVSDGLVLENTGAATASNQRYSPFLTMHGNGWKTEATAASQLVSFRQGVVPVQSFGNPGSSWVLQSQINGGGWVDQIKVLHGATGGIGQVQIISTASGGTKDDGALILEGGLGVEKNINTGQGISSGGGITAVSGVQPGLTNYGNPTVDGTDYVIPMSMEGTISNIYWETIDSGAAVTNVLFDIYNLTANQVKTVILKNSGPETYSLTFSNSGSPVRKIGASSIAGNKVAIVKIYSWGITAADLVVEVNVQP